MTKHIDYRIIEAAMTQGRVERAVAFRDMARSVAQGLRNTARALVAVFG